MKKFLPLSIFCASLFLILGVLGSDPAKTNEEGPANPHTAASALADLQAGSQRFASNQSLHPRLEKEISAKLSAEGQFPRAAVLACSDSRAPVEIIFDMGLGDLFTVRAAGAVAGPDQVGSLEYAVEHLNVPLIIVLGHTKCGAVSAAVAGAQEPGALGGLLARLEPAVQAVKNLPAQHQAGAAVVEAVDLTIGDLLKQSPVLSHALQEEKIKIIGAVYNLDSRQVFFRLNP
ncbi:MAG: hypothetical protein LBJ14_04680 [Desulfarculales bacterium]|jgi:carbonic anhydrase|nr:hypothetical protein [Desulfarculales bacterium]